MENSTKRRPWTEDDNAQLRSLAGTKPAAAVAAELGRTEGSVIVQASKLRLSMACQKPRGASFNNRESASSLESEENSPSSSSR